MIEQQKIEMNRLTEPKPFFVHVHCACDNYGTDLCTGYVDISCRRHPSECVQYASQQGMRGMRARIG